MFFRQILHEEKSCLSYIIGCKGCGVAAVIDPQGDPSSYLSILSKNGLKLTHVIETHVQADHVSSAAELARLSGATACFGQGAQVNFPHQELKERDTITIGNRRISILHTPGHTAEHICLYVDNWFVLTGDTLFVGDAGRVDLTLNNPSNDDTVTRAHKLYASLQKLLQLPEWTEIYPGHYAGSTCGKGMDGKPVSTIGRERKKNKALQLSEEEFIKHITQNLPPPPEDFQAIKRKNMANHG